MTQEEYDKRLAELEAEADRRGCCIIPATPIPPPNSEQVIVNSEQLKG